MLSPSGASWQELVGDFSSKMFQVLLQYFEDRFASICVDEPLSNYQDLLDRVKKAVPFLVFLQGVDDQQIVISYKDLSLQTFINIDRNDNLHASEALRNAFPCGSDISRYRKTGFFFHVFFFEKTLIRKRQARK